MMAEGLTAFQTLVLVVCSFHLIPLAQGPAKPEARNGRKSLTRAPWRGGKSLAVELPGVEFGGARQCPGGRNQSE